MSEYKQDILQYGDDVNDLDCSAFESLRTLHDRTTLHEIHDELDFDEKILLGQFDLKLIENAEEMVKQIGKVYDFSLSDKNNIPHDQWWWHLDKIARGQLNFGVSSDMGRVM